MSVNVNRRLKPLIYWSILALLLIAPAAALPTQQPPPCTETAGVIERPSYRSALIETNMVYSIYLPPCYATSDTAYPVLYLLHGSNDDDNHWLRLGLQAELDARIADGRLPPLIVVLPFGNWIANENDFGAASWGNVLVSELLPLVENTHRVQSRPASRAIGGISRGGFWAYQIGLRHPDLFRTIGGHSAFFDLYHAPDAYTPLDLALTLTPESPLSLWLDRGSADYAAPGLDLMHERLSSVGMPHTYTIYPEGEHNNRYWGAHLGDYLDFYAQAFAQAVVAPTPVAFITNTPRPEPTPIPTPSAGASYLLLPAVAFPSRLYDLSSEALGRVLAGEQDPALVLTEEVALVLAGQGYAVSALTPLVA
ncbi:MAG: hypothetical protein H7Y11_15520, partial [Armatimonadetes bacterium]|nr:hypothetical protein [Anaerolineae bacterium]